MSRFRTIYQAHDGTVFADLSGIPAAKATVIGVAPADFADEIVKAFSKAKAVEDLDRLFNVELSPSREQVVGIIQAANQ